MGHVRSTKNQGGLSPMIQQSMDFIAKFDPEVAASMQEELARQRRNIELIASEIPTLNRFLQRGQITVCLPLALGRRSTALQ